jgi:hypothetical protein
MSATNKYATYALDKEWTSDLKASTTSWIQQKLTEMQGESEENAVYIEYISTLIEHRKTMSEIASDLKDFFGEAEARLVPTAQAVQINSVIKKALYFYMIRSFANELGRQLATGATKNAVAADGNAEKNMSAATPSKAAVTKNSSSSVGTASAPPKKISLKSVVSTPAESLLDAPLAAGRGSMSSSSGSGSNNSRLLQSAIKSSKDSTGMNSGLSTGRDKSTDNKDKKRKAYDNSDDADSNIQRKDKKRQVDGTFVSLTKLLL